MFVLSVHRKLWFHRLVLLYSFANNTLVFCNRCDHRTYHELYLLTFHELPVLLMEYVALLRLLIYVTVALLMCVALDGHILVLL